MSLMAPRLASSGVEDMALQTARPRTPRALIVIEKPDGRSFEMTVHVARRRHVFELLRWSVAERGV